ncbi:MAG: aminomethyl-transferring glycine dehydrogenase subunit GcvPB [Candidatus Hodarchaeales archaeon]
MQPGKQASFNEPIIFEKSKKGRNGNFLPPVGDFLAEHLKRAREKLQSSELLRERPLNLPEVSELEVLRHYTRLAQMNYGINSGFYPLGSCTMKYNPVVNELLTTLPMVTDIHPDQPESTVQGYLHIYYQVQEWLGAITGLPAVSLQPAAGAHGEFAGLLVIRAYHEDRGETEKRTEILIPDTAHGTNPASATMAGFKIVVLPSNREGCADDALLGCVDEEALKEAVNDHTAGLMLTNPSTLGTFEPHIATISEIVHEAGGLLYYDGANLNSILGITRPGDMGFDVAHLNLHKTFSTPHGGGGPGAGTVCVTEQLRDFLPPPVVNRKKDGHYYLDYDLSKTIGKLKGYFGNSAIIARAYLYTYMMGEVGLKKAAQMSVLNANYLAKKITSSTPLTLPYTTDGLVKHEMVLSASELKKKTGVSALDVSKGLLDHYMHPPTVYFPLIVDEALMIEPTDTETKETLDEFAEALERICKKAETSPEEILGAPRNTPVSRIDEVMAARNPILSYRMKKTI